MSESNSNTATYMRLQIAYFLQFAIWGSYGFALTMFASATLKWPGSAMGMLAAAVPLGAFIGPMIFAPLADRYFSAQKVLAALQIVCGLLLCLAANMTGVASLTLTMFFVGVFYMSTVPLLNSIVFKHVPDSNKAPYVFVFGTIGWILVVLFIQAFFGEGLTNGFFYVGAGCCFLQSVYALTLPDTPPQGQAADAKGDALGLKAFTLLKDPSFLIFTISILLAGTAACGFFFLICGPMLTQRGYPSPMALTTLNQFSELFFMTALPLCAMRFGLKKVLLIGMAAWFIRYAFWMSPTFGMALAGLLVHGMCYSFLYNASYMYGDRVSPPEMKASVQGMLAFLLLGVGQVLGALLGGMAIEMYPAPLAKSEAMFKLLSEEDYMKTAQPIPSSEMKEEKTDIIMTDPAPSPDTFDMNSPSDSSGVLPGLLPMENAFQSPSTSTSGRMLALADAPVEGAEETLVTETSVEVAVEGKELTDEEKEELSKWKSQLPAWNDKNQDNSAWRYLDLKTTLLGPPKPKKKPSGSLPDGTHLGLDVDTNNDGKITNDEINAFPEEGLVYNEMVVTRDNLRTIFREVYAVVKGVDAKTVNDADIVVTREEYLQAKAYDWPKILLIPMILAGLGFVLFLVGGKDPKAHDTEQSLAEEAAPVGAGEGVVVPEEN